MKALTAVSPQQAAPAAVHMVAVLIALEGMVREGTGAVLLWRGVAWRVRR